MSSIYGTPRPRAELLVPSTLLTVPQIYFRTGDHGFQSVSPKLWNSLPISPGSLDSFKKQLKTHLSDRHLGSMWCFMFSLVFYVCFLLCVLSVVYPRFIYLTVKHFVTGVGERRHMNKFHFLTRLLQFSATFWLAARGRLCLLVCVPNDR